MKKPKILQNECIWCGICFDECPYDAMDFLEGDNGEGVMYYGHYEINDNCKYPKCKICIAICPVNAIDESSRREG